MRVFSFFYIILWAVLIMLSACSKDNSRDVQLEKNPPPLVKVQPAKRETISRMLEFTGQVVATKSATIYPTVEGTIVFCPYYEGDRVRLGEKLIEIDRTLYRQEVEYAEASLKVAEAKLKDLKAGTRSEEIAQAKETVRELEESTSFAKEDLARISRLVKSGSLPAEALDKARVEYITNEARLKSAKERLKMLKIGPTKTDIEVQEAMVKEAKSRLSLAKAKLAECIITAPFTGIISKVYVHVGDTATLKSPLIKMYDTSSLVVRFSVPESESTSIHLDTPAKVRLDAYPARVFNARITRLYPELEQSTRTRTVEATINEDVDIIPGMFARVLVPIKTVQNAIVVPDSAILTTPTGNKIAFVVNNGKSSLRKVKTGIEQGYNVQVLEGIHAGELVVVLGNEKLKDGLTVRVMKPKNTTGNPPGSRGRQ